MTETVSTTMISTGYVAFICGAGELPWVLAYEPTAKLALDRARKAAEDEGEDVEMIEVVHVDCYASRHDFAPDTWVLFGAQYAPDGDVAVRHGSSPKPRGPLEILACTAYI